MLVEIKSSDHILNTYLNPDHIIEIAIHSLGRMSFHVNIHLTKGDPVHTVFTTYGEARNYVDNIIIQCNAKFPSGSDLK